MLDAVLRRARRRPTSSRMSTSRPSTCSGPGFGHRFVCRPASARKRRGPLRDPDGSAVDPRQRKGHRSECRGQIPGSKRYARDLDRTRTRGKLDPVIGRDDEIRRVVQVLSRRTKNVRSSRFGPASAKQPSWRVWRSGSWHGDVPESLKKKQMVALDLGAMLAERTIAANSRTV